MIDKPVQDVYHMLYRCQDTCKAFFDYLGKIGENYEGVSGKKKH